VRPDLVVVDAPDADLHARFAEIGEPALVQALVAEPPVEALENWFADLEEARTKIGVWRIDYNGVRPHSALGNRTPTDYAQRESLHHERPTGGQVNVG
jgi:transposase InsO family protein